MGHAGVPDIIAARKGIVWFIELEVGPRPARHRAVRLDARSRLVRGLPECHEPRSGSAAGVVARGSQQGAAGASVTGREWAEEQLADDNPEALFMDGLDEAIVGIGRQYPGPTLVIYDADLIVAELAKDMGVIDAQEYASFNVFDAYVGPNTPIVIHRPDRRAAAEELAARPADRRTGRAPGVRAAPSFSAGEARHRGHRGHRRRGDRGLRPRPGLAAGSGNPHDPSKRGGQWDTAADRDAGRRSGGVRPASQPCHGRRFRGAAASRCRRVVRRPRHPQLPCPRRLAPQAPRRGRPRGRRRGWQSPAAITPSAAPRRGIAAPRGTRQAARRRRTGPALRAALGPHWRGRWVTVRSGGGSVVVQLRDFCGCPGGRVIDLHPGAFDDVAPLSRGVVPVRVSW